MKKLIIPLLCLSFSSAYAEKFGAAIVGVSTPQYMGADQNIDLIFPIPLFSSMFDQNKDNNGLYFDFTIDFNFPISSQDINDTDKEKGLFNTKNLARRGMDDLPFALYGGIKTGLNYNAIDLSLSATPGRQIGGDWKSAGFLSKLELTWSFARFESTEFILIANTIYADKRHNELYYGVNENEVITGRGEYGAKEGDLGTNIGLHFHTYKPLNSYVFGIFLEHQDMNNSVVKNSPLVKKKNNTSIGFGFGKMF